MLKRWEQAFDKEEYISAMHMDLSKAFDTINDDLLVIHNMGVFLPPGIFLGMGVLRNFYPWEY